MSQKSDMLGSLPTYGTFRYSYKTFSMLFYWALQHKPKDAQLVNETVGIWVQQGGWLRHTSFTPIQHYWPSQVPQNWGPQKLFRMPLNVHCFFSSWLSDSLILNCFNCASQYVLHSTVHYLSMMLKVAGTAGWDGWCRDREIECLGFGPQL